MEPPTQGISHFRGLRLLNAYLVQVEVQGLGFRLQGLGFRGLVEFRLAVQSREVSGSIGFPLDGLEEAEKERRATAWGFGLWTTPTEIRKGSLLSRSLPSGSHPPKP